MERTLDENPRAAAASLPVFAGHLGARDAVDPWRWLIPIIAVLFFGSGVSALIYQTLWLRMLALVFGVTVYAASTVLASFMTGLALGSLLASRIAHRITKPLVWFGAAEVLVGAAALATPELFELTRDAYVARPSEAAEAPRPGDAHPLPDRLRRPDRPDRPDGRDAAARHEVVADAPGPARHAHQPALRDEHGGRDRRRHPRRLLSRARSRACAARSSSRRRSTRSSASSPSRVGSVRMRLRPAATAHPEADLRLRGVTDSSNVIGADTSRARRTTHPLLAHALSPRTRLIVLGVFALSGVASLALEVLWFRVLVIFLRPTTYAFTIMLGNVLAGIAIGSAVMAPLMKRRLDWLAVLALMELALAVVVLSSFTAIGWSLDLSAWLAPMAFVKESRTLSYLLPLILAGLVAILPASLLLGAAFPVGLRLWSAG